MNQFTTYFHKNSKWISITNELFTAYFQEKPKWISITITTHIMHLWQNAAKKVCISCPAICDLKRYENNAYSLETIQNFNFRFSIHIFYYVKNHRNSFLKLCQISSAPWISLIRDMWKSNNIVLLYFSSNAQAEIQILAIQHIFRKSSARYKRMNVQPKIQILNGL